MRTSYLTPAALSREAQRRRHMAKHAADCPPGYTPDRWRRHCLAVAETYEREAMRGTDGRMH